MEKRVQLIQNALALLAKKSCNDQRPLGECDNQFELSSRLDVNNRMMISCFMIR